MENQSIEIHDGTQSFENDTMIAVMSNQQKNGTMLGSYVIIPKTQVGSPFELSSKEWADTKALLAELKEYLDKTYNPDGYNIGWNVGEVAGQHVAHAHLHVIPRYKDEPLAGKGLRHFFKGDGNIRTSAKIENQ